MLSNGGFEDGSSGWSTPTNATLTADGTGPVQSGSLAGRLTADASGAISVSSQYWWAPIDALAEYTLSIQLHLDDPGISAAVVKLEVVDGDGQALATAEGSPETGTGWLSVTTESVQASALAEYVRVVVSATATSAGAVLHIDSAVVATAEATPTPTPTPTATATATPAATAPRPQPDPTVSGTPVVEQHLRPSSIRRPEPTPAPSIPAVPDAPPPGAPTRRVPPPLLRNGDFEDPDGLTGWHSRGGEARRGVRAGVVRRRADLAYHRDEVALPGRARHAGRVVRGGSVAPAPRRRRTRTCARRLVRLRRRQRKAARHGRLIPGPWRRCGSRRSHDRSRAGSSNGAERPGPADASSVGQRARDPRGRRCVPRADVGAHTGADRVATIASGLRGVPDGRRCAVADARGGGGSSSHGVAGAHCGSHGDSIVDTCAFSSSGAVTDACAFSSSGAVADTCALACSNAVTGTLGYSSSHDRMGTRIYSHSDALAAAHSHSDALAAAHLQPETHR